MTRTLLIIVAVGALVSLVCLGMVHALGGFKINISDDDHGSVTAQGPAVSRDLPWKGGGSLRIAVPSTITYTQGPVTRFTVTGPKSVVDALTLDDDGELSSPDNHHWRFDHDRRLTVVVTSPNTHDFHLSGAQEMSLKAYDQDTLSLHIAGAAEVSGEGHAKTLTAHLSGAGEMDLGKLSVDDATVHIAGAGDATIDPHVSADVSIAGAGHIGLKTRPPTMRQHIAGFGSIEAPDKAATAVIGSSDSDDSKAKSSKAPSKDDDDN